MRDIQFNLKKSDDLNLKLLLSFKAKLIMVTVNDKEYIALKLELWQIQGDEVLT